MLASAQAVAEEMNVIRESVIRESVLVLEGEWQALRTGLLQPGPPPQPKPEQVQVPPGASDEFADPDATSVAQPNMDVERVGGSSKKMRPGRSPESRSCSGHDLWNL